MRRELFKRQRVCEGTKYVRLSDGIVFMEDAVQVSTFNTLFEV